MDIRIPAVISSYVREVLKSPALLIGCRASSSVESMPCCEYDIMVWSVDGRRPNQVLNVGSHWTELIYVPVDPSLRDSVHAHAEGIIVYDTDDFRLSSIKYAEMENKTYTAVKSATARRLLVSCLMRYNEIVRLSHKSYVLPSMLLKISAYDAIHSMLLFAGLPTSPIHQMDSLRQPLQPAQFASESVSLMLEIIGVERATASLLRRCLPAYSRLAFNRYDYSLIEAKIKYLFESDLVADCYYYLGQICSNILKSLRPSHWASYEKMIQIALDLNVDSEQIQKWNSQLLIIVKALLRHYRTVIAG